VETRKIRFCGWELDPDSGHLSRGGSHIRLAEQSLKMLLLLIEHRGSVVPREQLIAHLWPNGVVDFDTGLNTIVHKIRAELGDVADTPLYIETLPRRGYRFIAPLDELPAAVQNADSQRPASASLSAPIVLREHGLAPTAVAVLPFENLSADSDNEFLALGIAEAVLHRLAEQNGLVVIARSSSASFRNRKADAREIGRALDARYLVDGSVQRSGEKLRVTAQLVDAASGGRMWSMSFDGRRKDIFAMQDDIAGKVADALAAGLSGEATSYNGSSTP
jgi:TolB-like protein